LWPPIASAKILLPHGDAALMARTPKRSPPKPLRKSKRALQPPDPSPINKLATAKSQRTYERIIDAAIESFLTIGYARTSMSSIAERAGLTRSRVQYYFASTEALLAESTRVLLERVWRRFLDRLYASPSLPDDALDRLMALRSDPEHIAWMELLVASRTDPMLRRIVERAQRELDRESVSVQRRLLAPATEREAERLRALADLVRFVLEGLTLSVIADDGDRRVEQALRAFKSMLASYWGRSRAARAG
jgi:AcrR family transcriptional regulator